MTLISLGRARLPALRGRGGLPAGLVRRVDHLTLP
uniref:Uncharacterized protein n=1 Tax=Arundo donax TaxID=35708 RepID=A0A0A9EFP4_ARUDO